MANSFKVMSISNINVAVNNTHNAINIFFYVIFVPFVQISNLFCITADFDLCFFLKMSLFLRVCITGSVFSHSLFSELNFCYMCLYM